MTKITHITSGMLAGYLLYNGRSVDALPQIVAMTVGSCFPDLDLQLGFGDESDIAKHRGLTHTVVFAGIVFVLAWVLKVILYQFTNFPSFDQQYFETGVMRALVIPFCLGILLHIFLDSMTPAGVQPFMPFSNLHLWLFATPKTAKVHRGTKPDGTPYIYKTNRGIPSNNVPVNLGLSAFFFYTLCVCDKNGYTLYNIQEWLPTFFVDTGRMLINGLFSAWSSLWSFITALVT